MTRSPSSALGTLPRTPLEAHLRLSGDAELAYETYRAELEALPAKKVGRISTDVPTAIATALAVAERVKVLVPRMREVLKEPPEAEIERLPMLALALLHAHLEFVPPSKVLAGELEEARALRELLLVTAEAHAAHGQLDAKRVAHIRKGAGHLDRVNDLLALSTLYRQAWPVIGGRTPVTEEQLDQAYDLSVRLLGGLGRRMTRGTNVEQRLWADRRNRAFRLLLIAYEEIRDAVKYVRRHEGDVDDYAPALFKRDRSLARKRKKAKQPEGLPAPSPTRALPRKRRR